MGIQPMRFDPETEAKIRKRIEQKIEKRNEFITHALAYVVINPVLWSIYYFANSGFSSDAPWALWVTVLWGAGLFAHFLDYYFNHGAGRERHERYVEREIERERQKLFDGRKLKHDELYDDPAESQDIFHHLSDDEADRYESERR